MMGWTASGCVVTDETSALREINALKSIVTIAPQILHAITLRRFSSDIEAPVA